MPSTGASGVGSAQSPTIQGYSGYVHYNASASGGPDTSFRDAGFAVEPVGVSLSISLYMDGVLVSEQRKTVSQVTWDTVSVDIFGVFLAPPGPHDFYIKVGGTVSGHWVANFVQGASLSAGLTTPDPHPNTITVREVYNADAPLPAFLVGTVAGGTPSVSLVRLPGTPIAVGTVTTDGSGGWSAPITGAMTSPASYRATVTAPASGDFAAGNLTYDFETSALTVTSETRLRRTLGLFVESITRLSRVIPMTVGTQVRLRRVLNDPLDRSIDALLIETALAPVHTFSARLWIRWDGVNWYDETGFLLDAGGVDDVDLELRRLNTSDATVTLDNGDLRYSQSNIGGTLYPYLGKIGQEAYIEAGYGGRYDVVFRGVVDSLVPRTADRTAVLRLVGRTAAWQQARVTYGPATNVTADAVIRAMLTSIGLAEGVDFVLDAGETTLPFALASDAPLMEELAQLTLAEGGRLFVDGGGVLRWWNKSHTRRVSSQPILTLSTLDHLYDLARATTPQGLATELSLEYLDRTASAAETVYQQDRAIVVMAASQAGGEWYPSPPVRVKLMAQDYVRWERHFPVAVTAIGSMAGNTAADGSGFPATLTNSAPPKTLAAPSDTIYYQAEFATGYATLTFWGAAAAQLYITSLQLTGTPQRPSAPWAVVVDDQDAIERYGRIPATVRSAYLPTTATATELAREMLAARSAPLNRIDVPLQDGLPFLRPFDVIHLVDHTMVAGGADPEQYDIQVLRNEWTISPDQGYTQRLLNGPSLPPQFAGLATASPPAAAVLATTTSGPPWYYGPGSAHDGTFGFTEFS